MALIDVLDHSDRIVGSLLWAKTDKHRRTKGWRLACEMWMRAATKNPDIADTMPEPVRRMERCSSTRTGRSMRWWVMGVVRKEGVVEVETVRKRVRACCTSELWERMLGALNGAVERAVHQGDVLRAGSILVSRRLHGLQDRR